MINRKFSFEIHWFSQPVIYNVGWYIVSDGPIDELESLVDCTDLVDIGFYVDRQYWEAGKRYYRMFAPKTWL